MKRYLIYLTVAAVAAMAAGCSGSEVTPTEPDRETPGVEGGGQAIMFGGWLSAGSGWRDGRGGSRGDEIESETPDNIGVFAFGDGANTTYIFRNQKVLWRNGEEYLSNPFRWDYGTDPVDVWPYTTEAGGSVQRPWENMRYRFFAYSPWTLSDYVSVTAENYTGFSTFTWSNIPGFTDDDYVLSNEISDVDNRGGTFTSLGNVMHFSLRHILSRIRFFFKVDERYNEIRRIKLNSVTVLTAGKVKTATFNFKNDAWDEIVNWSDEELGDSDPVELTSMTGLDYQISTMYGEPFASVYVYPQDKFNEVKLKLDYTVYDRAGVETRHPQLENSVTLPDWELLGGYYYDIKILVAPSYLYVLSDNDQDFDGYVIIKDEP